MCAHQHLIFSNHSGHSNLVATAPLSRGGIAAADQGWSSAAHSPHRLRSVSPGCCCRCQSFKCSPRNPLMLNVASSHVETREIKTSTHRNRTGYTAAVCLLYVRPHLHHTPYKLTCEAECRRYEKPSLSHSTLYLTGWASRERFEGPWRGHHPPTSSSQRGAALVFLSFDLCPVSTQMVLHNW